MCNNLGQLTKREIGTGADKQTYNYTYDYLGRMLTETDAKDNGTEYQYDIDGNTRGDGSSVCVFL